MMKVVAIIQARMGSTRLPGKVLMDIEGKPMLQRVVERTRRAQLIDEVIVSSTFAIEGDPAIQEFCFNQMIMHHRYLGSEDDVLGRYAACARLFEADWIVRVTGDMPLVDPEVIDDLLEECWVRGYQYGEVSQGGFVKGRYVMGHGFRCQVFTAEVLRVAQLRAEPADREHVVGYMRRMWLPRGQTTVPAEGNYSVNTQEDLDRVRDIYRHFQRDDMTWKEVVDCGL